MSRARFDQDVAPADRSADPSGDRSADPSGGARADAAAGSAVSGSATADTGKIGSAAIDAAAATIDAVLRGTQSHLIVRTSGSTGEPKRVALSGAALRASATATYARIGGPGQWLLCLPVDHIAGLQVLVRSHIAGRVPIVMDRAGTFTADEFITAASRLTADRRYVSLVPTQLHRLLESPEAVAQLRGFAAVLLGGAAPPPAMLTLARKQGIAVVTTYGMTETAGGCVYDGVPLDGVEVGTAPDGRILLRGPVLADGYLDDAGQLVPLDTAEPNIVDGTSTVEDSHATAGITTDRLTAPDADGSGTAPSARWLRTQDRGTYSSGRLVVEGRIDDMIISGGVNVSITAVTRAVLNFLALTGERREVHVAAVPDHQWGERIVIAVTGPSPVVLEDEFSAAITDHIRQECGRAATPVAVVQLAELPLLRSGKADRTALRAQVARIIAARVS